ncbi:MAG: LysE family translocator [Oceanospirillaceae bacterium]|nr:LysE family translocator [Oceanospirillaceae bacterium]
MDLASWIIFASILGVASISPGPNVIAVIVQTLNLGAKGAFYTILGNLIALFTVALAAAIGVGALLLAVPAVFGAMKIAGGIYLVWMGLKMLSASLGEAQGFDLALGREQKMERSPFTLIFKAMLISYSNPKSILFLSAVFPAFLDQTKSVPLQFGIMFISVICIVATVHGIYALLAFKMKGRLVDLSARKLLARISGITFIGFGCGFIYEAQK